MNCRTCDYRLWNLRSRTCPECGTAFLPTEFTFVPNAVEFHCPHCGQCYFGTDERGQLVPRTFACVKCAVVIDMDEMVLTPADGLEEEQTGVGRTPWLRRGELGFFRAWMRTIGWALVKPHLLMRETRLDASASAATGFALLTMLAVWFLFIAPILAIQLFFASARQAAQVAISMVICVGGGAAAYLLGMLLWSLAAHGVLRLTGTVRASYGRSYQAFAYASGANAVSAVPIIGWYFGWIWALISTVVALKEAQRVSGWRAALAVIPPPLLLGGGAAVGVFMLAMWASSMASGISIQGFGLATSLTGYVASHNGAWPPHAAALIHDGGATVSEFMFVSSPSSTPLADTDLLSFSLLSEDEQADKLDDAVAKLPPNVIAHRLGDWVFTYHGVPQGPASAGLWIAINSVDPKSPGTIASPIVITADGVTTQILPGQFPAALQAQNALRQQFGLAPLPDPSKVTHDAPAVSGGR